MAYELVLKLDPAHIQFERASTYRLVASLEGIVIGTVRWISDSSPSRCVVHDRKGKWLGEAVSEDGAKLLLAQGTL